jgi:hypothetical protein
MAMTLADVRAKYPQYKDVDDKKLADAIYNKHYAGKDRREFDARIGLKPYDNALEATGTAIGNLPASIAESKYGLGQMAAEAVTDIIDPQVSRGRTPPLKVTPGAPIADLVTQPAAPSYRVEGTGIGKTLPDGTLSPVNLAALLPEDVRQGVAETAAYTSLGQQLRRAEAAKDQKAIDVAPGSLEEIAASAGASTVEMAAPAIASVLARNPGPLVAYFTARSAGTGYNEARDAGAGTDTARAAAGLYAAAEAVTEAVAGKVFVEGGKTLIGSVLKGVGVEGLTEAATEAIQALVDSQVIGKEMTLDEALNRIKVAGAAGAVAGGAIAPITHAMRGSATNPTQGIEVTEPVVPEADTAIEDLPALPGPPTLLALPSPEQFKTPDVPRRQGAAPVQLESKPPTEDEIDYQAKVALQRTKQAETAELLQTARETITPLGTFDVGEIGEAAAGKVRQHRIQMGRPVEAPVTIEDMARARVPQRQIDAVIAQRRPLTSETALTALDIMRSAEAKNIIPTDGNFAELALRTTGQRNPARMTQAQLNALKTTLDAMPAHAAPVTVPLADQSPFTDEQYGKALDAVRQQGRYTATAIKEATGLKNAPDVNAIRDAMVRRGQLVERGKGDYRLYDTLGVERQSVPDDLPPGAFKEYTTRRVPVAKVRVVKDGKSVGTFASAAEARGEVSKIREKDRAAAVKIEPAEETAWGVMENRYDEQGNLLGSVVVDSHRDEAAAQKALDQLNTPADTGARYTQTNVTGTTAYQNDNQNDRPIRRKDPMPPAFTGRLPEIVKALNDQARDRKLPLLGVRVQIKPSITTPEGDAIEGFYLRKLISLTAQNLTPEMSTDEIVERLGQVMDHETIHALRAAGVLGPETDGWKTIVRYARRAKRPGGTETYLDWARRNYANVPGYETNDSIEEEAIAEAFRAWASNRRNVAGKPATVFRQLVDWFKRLLNAVPEDAFKAIETGALVANAIKPPGGEMPRAKATRKMEVAAAGVSEAQKAKDENLLRVRSREYLRARAQARDDRYGKSGPKTVLGTTPSKAYATGEVGDTALAKSFADTYRSQNGVEGSRLMTLLPVDPSYMARVADAQQRAVHAPGDAAVAKAYRALIDETKAMYRALGDLEVMAWQGAGAPYASPAEMLGDIADGRLKLRLSDDMFGPGADNPGHPLNAASGLKTAEGLPLTNNDLFRVVHDVFGHGQSGFRDDARGAYNAYHEHARLLSPEARRALATETLAQRSWQDFGQHLRRRDGTVPRETDIDYLPPNQKEFAEQKAFLLDDEVVGADPGWALADRASAVELDEVPSGWGTVDTLPPVLTEDEKAELTEIVRRVSGLSDVRWHERIKIDRYNEGWGKHVSEATGYYDPTADVVALTTQWGNPRSAYHEAFHRLQWKLLTDAERKTLRAEENALRAMLKRNNEVGRDIDRMALSEVEAEAFALWAAGDAPAPTKFAGVWQKIKDILARAGNFLAGQGYRIPKDIFEAAKRGDYVAREAKRFDRAMAADMAAIDRAEARYSRFDDNLPGGRLYGNPDRSPGGALSAPGTPSPAFTSERPGNAYFGGELAEAQLEMVRTGDRGAALVYLSPEDFLALAGTPQVTLQTAGYKRDNPAVDRGEDGREWLARKVEAAEENYDRRKGIGGAATAYFDQRLDLPTSELRKLRGARGENRVPGDQQFDDLMAKVKANGWKQDAHPILVTTNHRGETFIVEGNTRVAVAAALGKPTVRAEVKWVNGGETASPTWSPEKVIDMANSVLAENPEQDVYDEAVAQGFKFSGLPSLVIDGYAGNVRGTASDGAFAAQALAGQTDSIPVVLYPRKGESLGLVTALEGKDGTRVPWPHDGRQENFPEVRGPRYSVGSEEFRRWFGDSKVVDAEGRPVVAFHSTGVRDFDGQVLGDFEVFNRRASVDIVGRDPSMDNIGLWFGVYDDPAKDAHVYGGAEGITYPVFLSIQNPWRPPSFQRFLEKMHETAGSEFSGPKALPKTRPGVGDAEPLREWLQYRGYDGIVFPKGSVDMPGQEVWVALEPNQIKSAIANRGTYDMAEADIRYSLNAPMGTRVPSEPPGPMFNIVQQRVDGWVGRAVNAIGRSKKSLPIVGSVFDARVKLQDKMLSIKEMIEQIKEAGGSIDDLNDTYMLEQLYHGKVFDQIQQREQELQVPLLEALRAAHDGPNKVTPKDFEDFLYARHAPERNAYLRARGATDPNPAGMSDAEASSILDQLALDGKMPDLEVLASMADAIVADTTRTRVEAGLISEEAAASSPYQHYIPLRGFAEEELDPGNPSENQTRARSGKGFSVGGREDRTVTGRGRKAGDLLGHLFLQNTEAVIRAEKNSVALSFMRLLQQNKDLGFGQILKTAPTRRVVGANGMIHEAGDPSYRQAPDIVTAKWKGKEVVARVADPRLARAIKSDYVTTSNDLVNALTNIGGKLNRYLATVNTSLNPEFLISNLARDMQTAGILSQQYGIKDFGKKIIGNAPKAMAGIREVLRTGEATGEWAQTFREMQKAGGTTEFLGIHDLETQVGRIRRSITQTGLATTPRKALEYLGKVGKFIDDYNKVAENAFRLSAFKAAREAGASTPQAAYLAKNLTVNFNKGGELKAFMNAFYLFYNASTQGSAVLMNGLKNKRVQKIVGGVVVAGLLQDILNRALSGDDDENGVTDYDDIPDYVLETNFVLMDPLGILENFGIKSGYFAIPMPYGFNAFYNTGRNLSAGFSGSPVRNPGKSAVDSLLGFMDAFNPLGGVQSIWNFIAPTFADPVVDLITNKDFAGNDIVPERPSFGLPVPDSQKYWSNTDGIPVWVSEHLNRLTGGNEVRPGALSISPETLQYGFDYATGATGKFVQRLVKLAFDTTPKALQGDFEEIEIGDIPFARRVVGSIGKRGNTERYYAVAQEVQTIAAELEMFAESGRVDEARRVAAGNPVEVSLIGMFEDAEKALQGLRKQLREVRETEGMPAARKREIEKQIKEAQDQIMSRVNNVYFQAKEAGVR